MAPERKGGVQKRRVDKSGLGRAIINRKAKLAKIMADPDLVSRRPARDVGHVVHRLVALVGEPSSRSNAPYYESADSVVRWCFLAHL